MYTWRDVFDAYKLSLQDIYAVNQFLYNNTAYFLFAFNGIIYKTSHPKAFTTKDCDTGLTVYDLK